MRTCETCSRTEDYFCALAPDDLEDDDRKLYDNQTASCPAEICQGKNFKYWEEH